MAEVQQATKTPRNPMMVGCKLQNGATLRLHTEETFRVPDGANKMRDETRFIVNQEAPVVTLPGIATAKGESPKALLFNGATITPVDPDFMRAWMDQNKKHPWLTNNMIFVAESRDGAEGKAKDLGKVLSGQQPMNPVSDPRATGGRFKVTAGEAKAA